MDDEIKEELSQLPITLLCIHGNHEERPEFIDSYTEKMWRGGLVFFEEDYPNILFAKDGEIYDFDGRKAIAIGGAYSIDKYYRLYFRLAWFESEQPMNIQRNMLKINWKQLVGKWIMHYPTGPLKHLPYEKFLPDMDQSQVTSLLKSGLIILKII